MAGTGGSEHQALPVAWRRGILLAAMALFAVLALHQAGRDAPTVDEGVDVSSGIAALVHRDARMVPEHPLLPKALAAAPALLAHPIVPKGPAWEQGDWFGYSDRFIAANESAGRLHDVLLWSRAVIIAEVLLTAWVLQLLTARWFGPDGGLLAAVAWLTTPYVIGLGHVAMIDSPFVLVTVSFSLLLARWWDRPDTGRSLALGAVLAAALASRHTGLVLALVAVGVVAYRFRRTPRDGAVRLLQVGLVAMAGLWLVYRVVSPGGPPPSIAGPFQGLIAERSAESAVVRLVGHLPLPLEWRAGFAYLDLTSTARPASLFGHSWDGGRWWYFPASAVLKLPLWLVLAVIGGWVRAVRTAPHRRQLAAFVVAPGLALWLTLVLQPLNLGLRLALPVVALAYVGLGALAEPIRSAVASVRTGSGAPRLGAAAGVGVAVVLVVAQVGSAVVSDPHSLAWTPRPWRPAYRWVSDANLDAGQALYELRAWSLTHHRPLVDFDSTRGLDVGGGSRRLRAVPPEQVRGWVAVGVTPLMQTRRDDLAWLRAYCPVATLGGGSVLVYRFRSPPRTDAGPERPVPPCFDQRFSS